ncbi:hypothetical protein KM176_20345 [Pseudooceanicola sp. CBS1P-1]|uniref:Multidrug resistance protein NorM n=1 Tax=Pseudooceanicola albus TaxID=2692189 RepID=A0A6L7G9F0_9RHOB|nr:MULTISPECIES: hypothetical protein [Pseudooceanicola]MBT9386232.1 hypothetical protein [Pseudooceanicola endophyticus]MXN20282.1 hypothetical protein [Pseudooceanicola albus]
MSSVDAPTLTPAKMPSIPGVLGQIFALAIPFALGAAITSALNLGKIALLARAPDTGALQVLSLLQPAFILILAMMEALAITNQVFSARSRHAWPRRGVRRATLRLGGTGIVIFLGVAAAGQALALLWPTTDPTLRTMLDHAAPFVLSMIPFVLFDICYGALRGQGKVLAGLLPFAALVAVDLAVTWTLVSRFGWGFEAVLAGNVTGALLMLPVIALLLWRATRHADPVPDQPFRIRLKQLQIGVGLPVFSSLVVGFVSSSVIFPLLSHLGQEGASAFLVVLRYRIAFMIPAIAIGSAIAILVNQQAEAGPQAHPRTATRYLCWGIGAMLILYAGATALLPLWPAPLDLLVPARSQTLHAATEGMFRQLLVTFFLVAASAMFQVILEQLGRGVQVLIIAIVTELGTCAALLWAMTRGADQTAVIAVMIGFAALGFVLLAGQVVVLMRRMGGPDAV